MIVVLAKERPTAAFMCIVSDGAVLVLKRSLMCGNPGTWGFPGGRIEDGETPKQAAFRECREEVGSKPKCKVVLVSRVRKGKTTKEDYADIFLCKGSKKLKKTWRIQLNEEHTAYKWVSASWLQVNRNLLHPGIVQFLRHGLVMEQLTELCGEGK